MCQGLGRRICGSFPHVLRTRLQNDATETGDLLNALFALIVLGQDPEVTIPDVQPGSSQPFISAVRAVKEDLAAGKFEDAAKKANMLPRQEVTYAVRWDTIPAESRSYVERGIERAIKDWSGIPTEFKIKASETDPDIVISFSDQLGEDPESGERLGAVHFISFAPGEPRVDTVIALKRGTPPRTAELHDIVSEVAFAIGSRQGLERQPTPTTAMHRIEGSNTIFARPAPLETKLALINVEIGEALREAAWKKVKVSVPEAAAYIDVNSIEGGTVVQGDSMPMSFQVNNRGKNPLKFRVIPDCGCFILPVSMGVVEPGEAALVPIDIRTMEFPGPLNKSLFVYTDDPEMPVKRIPVTGMVEPLYRFLTPSGKTLFPNTGDLQQVEVFLSVHPKRPFEIDAAEITGVRGVVNVEPWSGSMADVGFGEAAREHKGYKLTLAINPGNLPGRTAGLLAVKTTDKTLGVLRWSFTLQKGIMASPGAIFFGEVDPKPTRAWALLQGGGRKFRITKIDSDSEFVKGSWEPMNDEDTLKLVAEFNGKAPLGRFSAKLTLHTDDPDQPTIEVPVQGTVR